MPCTRPRPAGPAPASPPPRLARRATTKQGQMICLNPIAPWVKLLITRILRRYLPGQLSPALGVKVSFWRDLNQE